ncbi:phospholipid-translocating P-type ATPase [Dothidotthia symphoricarpi CBS 119687]|uniref:Phospholipid-transporting ATPase n=1 Tax=Dothidotthia symphoricarpi CBS 119687 TaxID=1392245 RepID=A0A6A6AGE2_9PLEO|nr:phospholipid-translocating P-type ATPase [Dothidotthia symphoricarpi CBS 119687]KAF2130860.1 phospholipid-translocating P-type ATPase [Dothidotthia symphoricarpi CBS 119687]
MDSDTNDGGADKIQSLPVKRIRWATHRATGTTAANKRHSLKERLHRRMGSGGEKRDSLGKEGGSAPDATSEGSDAGSDEQEGGRRVYFNVPLPPSERDEDGSPTVQYARNKIRTAKYTPISFVPKNLWFQFHNVANIYFLFIIILGIFSIFGASNPALNAVPLIVILAVTAVKDAIEDWRRTILDIELNNAPIHRLVDFNNVNTAEDSVSMWRKFKKATTRTIVTTWRAMKGVTKKKGSKGKGEGNKSIEGPRSSFDTRRTSVASRQESYFGHQEDIQMTPVPSPLPGQSPTHSPLLTGGPGENDKVRGADSKGTSTKKFWGNVINPFKTAPEKARFMKDAWKSVQVGDFVRLYNDEEIPADVIVIATSSDDGACYVETKNLDGETNLKVRNALHCTRDVRHARHCERAEFVIESEGPHSNLYSYSAVMRWQQHNPKSQETPTYEMAEPISINNLLLRGCQLRNTEWVLGVVVFTGEDTKIMINSGITPSKRARISKELNWNVIYNFILLAVMCLISGVVLGTTWGRSDTSHALFEYGSYGGRPATDGIIAFWAAIILFQNLVPISLYITLEIIRTLQAYFIYSDTQMYYDKLDYPCTPKSWNISDDVGQIEYIFSDKTGTLTQNVMEFKKATINGVPYGEAYTEAQAGMQRRQGVNVEVEGARARQQIARDRVRMIEGSRKIHDNPYLWDDDLTFVAPDYIDDLAGESGREQKLANEQFMIALALCHTVVTEKTPGDPPRIEFKAQSPDEAALVATARDVGFTFVGREDDRLIVNVLGVERKYQVLNTLEFNSTRKRMSAIIRMPDGKIMLFCKGADSMIYSRLIPNEQRELRATTGEHLEMFAREGLRTLCIAQKEVSEAEYTEWNRDYDVAANAVAGREEKLEEVSDRIENQLWLIGGTAIEDRLQDGVPESISLLGQAGIKLWVLTGDKVETAINIGFSCNLLDNDMDLIILKVTDDNIASVGAQLDEKLAIFGLQGSEEELAAAQNDHEPPPATHALIIDGDTLKLALDDSVKRKFLLLCRKCRSVLCCRVSPSQKAAVVNMVKTGLDCLTLAIGDGANDVAMIQEAHVGVGIAGVEGRAAVMSSDYAIGQFRFLTRLLLVHGRWSYRRLAETIANFFYKNVVWTFALFWYQIYADFDSAYIFDYTYILLFNLAFTSLPVIVMGVLDQDVDALVSLAVPQLYRRGIERKEWTQPKFWAYMADGAYQSAVAFFFVYEIFAPATFSSSNGLDLAEYRRMGVYAATTAVCAANIYVLFNTYRWDWLMLTIVAVSTILIWIWTAIYTSFTGSAQFYKAGREVYGNLNFWAYVLLAIVACLLPRFMFKSAQKLFFPIDADIIREQVAQGKFDYLKDGTTSIPPPQEEAAKPEADATKYKAANADATDEDVRPIYPPSVVTTHNPRSTNGSNSTDFTLRRSMEGLPPAPRMSVEGRVESTQRPEHRVRPSFDRARMSMDPVRASFEQSNDFTSAAMLTRLESAHSRNSYQHPNPQGQGNATPMSKLRNALRRATITREEQPQDLDAPPMPKSPPGSPKR